METSEMRGIIVSDAVVIEGSDVVAEGSKEARRARLREIGREQ